MNTIIDGVDYGPLAQLIGKWIGKIGLDKAPEPDGEEATAYIDELTFVAAGSANNAEQQNLVAVRYHHLVRKKESDLIFHDQIGHWIYEEATGLVMHSLTIPRGVSVLAGGSLSQNGDHTTFDVKAELGNETFGVLQSPFMLEKAKTKAFHMVLNVEGDKMSYRETTSLYIYDKDFEHVDYSTLKRLTYDID